MKLFASNYKNYSNFARFFNQSIKNVKTNLISEKDILSHLRKHSQLLFKFRSYIDENITYIRKYHPEYLQTWKYYQEFEKMCEELDENQ